LGCRQSGVDKFALVVVLVRVMRLHRVVFLRGVSAIAGLALLASTAAASPLSAAVEQPLASVSHSHRPQADDAIVQPLREDRLIKVLGHIQFALTRVGDGSRYIWHFRDGTLSGSVMPTATLRRHDRMLCRRIVMELSSETDFRVAEGVACRTADGNWSLEG
jgi:surface antigen